MEWIHILVRAGTFNLILCVKTINVGNSSGKYNIDTHLHFDGLCRVEIP